MFSPFSLRRFLRCPLSFALATIAVLGLGSPSGFAEPSMAAAISPESGRTFRVMTFNTWHNWSHIDDGFAKAKAAITAADVDLIGLQESSPELAQRMADELGWHRAEAGTGSVQILSRHPILECFTTPGIGSDRFIGTRIRLETAPVQDVIFCDTHLDFEHYGPYAAHEPQASSESVLTENARSERVPQITADLSALKPWLADADSTPVILVGDFNVPSHLDWSEETAGIHGGIGPVAWPESTAVEQAGMSDSFRVAHPDPTQDPGTSWSAIHKEPEPQDRIDFIHFKGGSLRVLDSELFTTGVETTIGAWGTDEAPVRSNTWPSDHSAVITTFGFADSEP